jgi:hypothetical protein
VVVPSPRKWDRTYRFLNSPRLRYNAGETGLQPPGRRGPQASPTVTLLRLIDISTGKSSHYRLSQDFLSNRIRAMLEESKTAQRRRRNPTTAPGRGNHSRVPFSRHPAQSMVITGTGSS